MTNPLASLDELDVEGVAPFYMLGYLSMCLDSRGQITRADWLKAAAHARQARKDGSV